MDIYRHDELLRGEGLPRAAGIDEAGRGPIAGPVVAAAVVLMDGARVPRLRDSKKVPEKERETLFTALLPHVQDLGIGVIGVEDIERHNILGATRLAMQQAVDNLMTPPRLLLIDAVVLPAVHIKQHSIIRGDSKSASIAAASIVAKFVRDRIMLRYHRRYPQYGFDRHKGYCTREHELNVEKYGPSPIHRMGFRKVNSLRLPF